MYFLRLFRHH
ncbi:unnamed protein product [Spodoptera littoralis]|uniref:Uncharacterized protein n=1 Tax=Spodoptera littoralis TaxID=7109 RepID=A0A9P0HZC1_SPOLI|nr:unnamed protein product [Spodoptera littoralis]CAH1636742.1 unnamed protein product [Spodoptera littoralis]